MTEDMETTTNRQPTKRSHSMGRLSPINDQHPKRTTRRAARKTKPSPDNNNDDERLQINISTQNEFEALNDVMLIDEESPNSAGTSNRDFRPAFNPSKKNQTQKESRKPKPIIVTKLSHQSIQELLSFLKIKATLKKLNGPSNFKIFAESAADKKAILSNLKSKEIPHHTYCEPEDRHWTFVLKGHHQSDPIEVLKELQEAEIPATKVAMISKQKDNPIYLVFFVKDDITLNELCHKHRSINNLRVQWEKFNRTQKKPTQCRKCQLWGHSATNCGNLYKCVKCLENHLPGACARTTREGEASCINCNAIGHSANSSVCPHFQRYKANIDRMKPATKTFTSTRAPWANRQPYFQNDVNYQAEFPTLYSKPQPGTSQSGIVKVRTESFPVYSQNNHSASASQFAELQQEFNNIPGIDGALKLFAKLIKDLKNAPTEHAKAMVLFEFAQASK